MSKYVRRRSGKFTGTWAYKISGFFFRPLHNGKYHKSVVIIFSIGQKCVMKRGQDGQMTGILPTFCIYWQIGIIIFHKSEQSLWRQTSCEIPWSLMPKMALHQNLFKQCVKHLNPYHLCIFMYSQHRFVRSEWNNKGGGNSVLGLNLLLSQVRF